MKKILYPIILFAGLAACNDNALLSVGRSTSTKGTSEFRQRMAQGVGVFRPESFRTAGTLNLSGSSIASIKVDEHSGAWSWAGFDTTQGENLKADTDLFTAAKEFIAENESELGLSPGEVLMQQGAVQEPSVNSKMITLKRQFQGTEVKGSFINIFFAVQTDKSLRISEVVNNSYGPVRLSGNMTLLLDESDVKEATGIEELKLKSRRTVVIPSLKDSRYEFSYATEFILEDQENGEKITLTLDNSSRSIHEAYSNHVYEVNEIQAETYKTSYILKDLITRPLEYLRIMDGDKELSTDKFGKIDEKDPEN